MIVARLIELSAQERLAQDPTYEQRPVHALLRIDREGTLLRIDRGGPWTMSVPVQRRRTQGVVSYFLCDTIEYVVGLSQRRSLRETRRLEMHAAFRGLVDRAASSCDDDGLLAVQQFYARPPDARLTQLLQLPAGARVTFALHEDPEPICARAEAKAWWRRACVSSARTLRRCVATGARVAAFDAHPAIRHVPNAHIAGAALVSHNVSSGDSHGWTRHENAPFSADAANDYTRALNELLHAEPGRPRRRLELTPDTTAVFWSTADAPIMGELESFWRTGHITSAVAAVGRFHLLALSGATSRIVPRVFDEVELSTVRRSIERFVASSTLALRHEPAPIMAPRRLLSALAPHDNLAMLPPTAAEALCRSILIGTPPCRQLLSMAVSRCREERGVSLERACLIRFYFERRRHIGGGAKEDLVKLDPSNDNVGYRLGRAFALLETIDERHGRTSLRHRHYQTASIRPASAIPQLVRTALARDEAPSLTARLGEALRHVTDIPRLFSLEEQGQFALGYFHERQAV